MDNQVGETHNGHPILEKPPSTVGKIGFAVAVFIICEAS
tara:strand:- start:69 stop:185 length:117 start_codon:yes stop_codon:yes gene_type:complete